MGVILKPIDVVDDISKEDFWQRGFNLVNDKINELNKIK